MAEDSTNPSQAETVGVIYVGPFAAGVEIADTGQWVVLGEPVEVRADIAGRAPTGTPGEADYDPGVGLLAQAENFVATGGAVAESASISDVLAEVGDDPAKAHAAFAVERARGASARKTLLNKLGAIASAQQTGDSTDG